MKSHPAGQANCSVLRPRWPIAELMWTQLPGSCHWPGPRSSRVTVPGTELAPSPAQKHAPFRLLPLLTGVRPPGPSGEGAQRPAGSPWNSPRVPDGQWPLVTRVRSRSLFVWPPAGQGGRLLGPPLELWSGLRGDGGRGRRALGAGTPGGGEAQPVGGGATVPAARRPGRGAGRGTRARG